MEQIEQIIKKGGERNQLNIAIEEMSELTKEICKYKRDPIKWKHADLILEELADVRVMCLQIQEIFGLSDEELKTEMDFKINRTLERMKDD